MFVQVIEGRVRDSQQVHDALDQWANNLAPSAPGWLGTTAGVTDDGQFVALARFDSQESAQRNSSRPEQDQWWSATSSIFSGDVTFHDCPQAFSYRAADPGEAHFVQIIKGHARDPERVHQLSDQADRMLTDFRPELIGETIAMQPDGDFVEAAYFTDEPSARSGERKPLTGKLKQIWDEEMSLIDNVSYLDLRQSWTYRPAR